MKVLHIEARKKFDLDNVNWGALDSLKLKESVSLAASVQYLDLLSEVREYLEKKGINVVVQKGAFHEGQVLGCNANAFDVSADNLLLLCDGKFHALNNAIRIGKEILVFNGETVEKVGVDEVEKARARIKGRQAKFLSSKVVGLLVSTKFGQSYKNWGAVAEKLEKKGKEVYVFVSDNIDVGEFDNFNFIEIWVNTACFGIGLDDPRIVNLQDVLEFL
jgi:diphthamide biosynthesis enzyme Dph1/Dph2-like protein